LSTPNESLGGHFASQDRVQLIPPTINQGDAAHIMGIYSQMVRISNIGSIETFRYESILIVDASVGFYESVPSLSK